jgi:uncharacterized protein YrrD
MHITIGTPALADDGKVGRVARVIIHPATQEVEGVVVEQGGMLTHDLVIPIDAITGADEDSLRVRGTRDEIDSYPPFALGHYTLPPEDWIPPTDDPASIYLFPASPYAVGAFGRPAPQPEPPVKELETLGAGDVDVARDTPLFCRGREVGRLDRVFTRGETDRVTHLVVSRGMMRRDLAVPVELVELLDDDGIHLGITEEELDNLPPIDLRQD